MDRLSIRSDVQKIVEKKIVFKLLPFFSKKENFQLEVSSWKLMLMFTIRMSCRGLSSLVVVTASIAFTTS
jgi:hypothetical protein